MAVNFRSVKFWSGIFRNYLSLKQNGPHIKILGRAESARYSTVIPKCCIDVFEIFTDILIFNRSRSTHQQSYSIPALPSTASECGFDKLIQKLDTQLKENSITNIETELETNICRGNWNDTLVIVRFCIDRQVCVDSSKIRHYAETFSERGFLDGLKLLKLWYNIVDPLKYAQSGELTHYLAKCYWNIGNVKECVTLLRDCVRKYPALSDVTKMTMRAVICETVSSRSEAELRIIVDFVKQLTRETGDYYFISVLWNYLFLSDWYTDQSLANSLVDDHADLKLCVNLMSSSLTTYLIKNDRIADLYRFLQMLLKYEMKSSYGKVNQIMFDHFCEFQIRSF